MAVEVVCIVEVVGSAAEMPQQKRKRSSESSDHSIFSNFEK